MSRKAKASRKAAVSRKAFRRVLPKLKGIGDRTHQFNSVLVDLSKKTEAELEFWRVYQQYLVGERELRKERIHAALKSKVVSGFGSEQFVRIVDARYQNRPLSSYGSIIVPPGGRFNFGEISSYHQRFQALYLASDFHTAAAERFLRNQASDSEVDQTSLDLRLDPNASFSSYRIRVENLTVIDIREEVAIAPFVEVISEVELPDWLIGVARKLRQPMPVTVKNVDEMQILLADPNFTQSGALLDQPSVSQWFGYYAREAGIQGIIYSSVRDSRGYNLVVFPDNFQDSSARIELMDPAAGVSNEDRVLDADTAQFQMQISAREQGVSTH
jgi:RES domain-containing protein